VLFRSHKGGIVGTDIKGLGDHRGNLQSNEVLAVLKKGELVMTVPQMTNMGRMVAQSNTTNFGNITNKQTSTLSALQTVLPALSEQTVLRIENANNDGGLRNAVDRPPRTTTPQPAAQAQTINTAALETKMDQLIGLMKSGGIAVNLDGRKVSTGLMEVNRYG
jgi:hypothetical protein